MASAELTIERRFEIGDRFFTAVTAGDIETVRRLYRPDATIWHNYDGVTQSPDQNVEFMRSVTQDWLEFEFTDVRRYPVEDGFIQQHTMRGKGPDGTPFAAPAILLIRFDTEGFITGIEEYFHPAQLPTPTPR